jgi:hypothetical protein
MALALNSFQTVTTVVGLNTVGIYTAPVGYTGVVLLAQCVNVGPNSEDITFNHRRTNTVGAAVTTEILSQYPIASKDTANLLSGKLVLESGDVLEIRGTSSTNLKAIVSVLETLN